MMNCVNRLSNDERATTTKKLLYTFLATAVSTIWLERDHGPMVMLKTMDLLAAAVYAKGNGHHWSSLGVLNLRGWHPAWNVLLPGLRVLSIPRCLHVPSTMIIPTSLQSLDITSCRNISYDSFKPVARNLWILKARHITFHFPPMPSLRLLELGEGSRHISDEIIAEMKHLRVLRLYNHAYITDYALENKTRLEELVLCGNQNITTTPIYKKNMPLLRRFIMPGHPWLQDELGYILPKCRTIVTMYYACER